VPPTPETNPSSKFLCYFFPSIVVHQFRKGQVPSETGPDPVLVSQSSTSGSVSAEISPPPNLSILQQIEASRSSPSPELKEIPLSAALPQPPESTTLDNDSPDTAPPANYDDAEKQAHMPRKHPVFSIILLLDIWYAEQQQESNESINQAQGILRSPLSGDPGATLPDIPTHSLQGFDNEILTDKSAVGLDIFFLSIC